MERDLYDVARNVCHEFGFDWTDPRTLKTYKAPKKKITKKKKLKKKQRPARA